MESMGEPEGKQDADDIQIAGGLRESPLVCLTKFIEYFNARQILLNCVLGPKMNMYSVSIWGKSRSVETFWCQNVTVFSRRFSAPDIDDFANLMSLFYNFCLRQFRLPLLSLFWLAPGFVESDQVVKRLLRVRMFVTEFQASASDGFES